MDKQEATELWEEFRRTADPAIFERLYRAYRLPVMRYCRARIGDEEAAEDVTDRTFTYLAVARPVCRGNFESMVIYFARLRCANLPRANQPRSSGQLNGLADQAPPPLARVEAEEFYSRIDLALKKLTPDEQQTVVLHLLVGLSLTEVAGMTGLSRWTVGRRFRRAIDRLRQILKKT